MTGAWTGPQWTTRSNLVSLEELEEENRRLKKMYVEEIL